MGFFANVIRDSRLPVNKSVTKFAADKNMMAKPFYQESLYYAETTAPEFTAPGQSGETDAGHTRKNIKTSSEQNSSDKNNPEDKNIALTISEKKPSEYPFATEASESRQRQNNSEQQKFTKPEAQEFSISQTEVNENRYVQQQYTQSDIGHETQKYDSIIPEESEISTVQAMNDVSVPEVDTVKKSIMDSQETVSGYLKKNLLAESEIKQQGKIINHYENDDTNVRQESLEQLDNAGKIIAQKTAQEVSKVNRNNSQARPLTVNQATASIKNQQDKTPQVRIGQINVVIESTVKQAVMEQTGESSDEISSRLFLRGL